MALIEQEMELRAGKTEAPEWDSISWCDADRDEQMQTCFYNEQQCLQTPSM